jgi:hypothetical protein
LHLGQVRSGKLEERSGKVEVTTRCIHGLDSRFCANCNRPSAFSAPRQAIGSATLSEVLAFLNAAQVRATELALRMTNWKAARQQ